MVKSVVKSFLPKHTVAEKLGNARKTEILRVFGGRLTRRSHAPKPRALPTALHPGGDGPLRFEGDGDGGHGDEGSGDKKREGRGSGREKGEEKAPLGYRGSVRGLAFAIGYPETCTLLASARTVRCFSLFWGEIWDSNPRPSGPQPDALTNCANPTICFWRALGDSNPRPTA